MHATKKAIGTGNGCFIYVNDAARYVGVRPSRLLLYVLGHQRAAWVLCSLILARLFPNHAGFHLTAHREISPLFMVREGGVMEVW